MAKKKTEAQIRRLQKRAAARGEEYQLPEPDEEEKGSEDANPKNESPAIEDENRLNVAEKLKKELQEIDESETLKSKDRRSAKRKAEVLASEEAGIPAIELMEWYEKRLKAKTTKQSKDDPETVKRRTAAMKFQKELDQIDQSEELKAKDRRSAKRKAEAIASEESGMEFQELLTWYEQYKKSQPGVQQTKKPAHDPYIAFVGQMSFETTREELFQHIHTQLKNEHKIKEKDVKIRVLTDSQTKKSRGMAFVEVIDPEVLYALLKLHQTFLNGRRINIERSAGGKKNSEARKAKLAQYRKEQDQYFAEVVDSILKEYKGTGELREDELDAGVIALCKRHAGPIVRAAVAEYIEKGGRDMDNPSAYLSFLLTKFSTEGIREEKENATKAAPSTKRKGGSGGSNDDNKKRSKASSEFAQAGIDMSMSTKLAGAPSDITKIFPSARRGRGRGYM